MSVPRFRPESVGLLAAAACAFAGLSWGLPENARIERLLPAGWEADAVLHRRMAESRERLYEKLEENDRLPLDQNTPAFEVPGSWSEPPEALLSSLRSYFLRSGNADEQKNLAYLAHMKPGRFEFEPFGVDYGGAYLYPLGGYFAVLKILGAVRATSDLTEYFRKPVLMAGVFRAGRFFNAACFLIGGALLWRFGRGSSRWEGGLAAAFFYSSPVTVLVEHSMNPYGWATAWFLAGLLCLKGYFADSKRVFILGAGACFGAAVGSSFAFWPLGFFLLAPFSREKEPGTAFLRATQGTAAAGLVFVVSNPYLFLRFEKFSGQMAYLMLTDPFDPSWMNIRSFASDFLVSNWGLALTVAALVGAVRLLLDPRRPGDRLYAAVFFAGAAHLAGRTSDFAHGRHFLPFFALGAWFAARLLSDLFAARPVRAALAAAIILLDSGSVSASYLANFVSEANGKSTRYEASDWIAANVPAGSRVGFLAPPQFSETPPLRFERYDAVIFLRPEDLRGKKPLDFVVAAKPRANGPARDFLEMNFERAAEFGPRRLLPWIAVHGVYSYSNIEMIVFKRKERSAI